MPTRTCPLAPACGSFGTATPRRMSTSPSSRKAGRCASRCPPTYASTRSAGSSSCKWSAPDRKSEAKVPTTSSASQDRDAHGTGVGVDAPYARMEQLEPGIARVLAHNPSAFTYFGTQTYLVGEREVAVIDPGPDLPEHLDALEAAIGGRPVAAILCTHTHRDHSPAARP